MEKLLKAIQDIKKGYIDVEFNKGFGLHSVIVKEGKEYKGYILDIKGNIVHVEYYTYRTMAASLMEAFIYSEFTETKVEEVLNLISEGV